MTSFAYAEQITEKKLTQPMSIPPIIDRAPGYYETSEYMIGNCSVPVIFIESNGSIDTQTENWTAQEINEVLSEIQYALDWWSTRNPNASLSFYTDYSIVETSYEPITRNYSDLGLLILDEVMTALGYPPSPLWIDAAWNYINDFRNAHNTDWCFITFIVDSSNDVDGRFADGKYATNDPGGPRIFMTYDNGDWGISEMDRVTAHEIANVFWALDEHTTTGYSGYLNVINILDSGCLMDEGLSWCLSGDDHKVNGTWTQIGWRDSDADGIQDIVDTFPKVYFNPQQIIGNTINYTGLCYVTTIPNKNPSSNWNQRNVTINKIQNVQYKIDDGNWTDATITHSYFKQTTVNFTFVTDPLLPGEHNITMRATNQWGNSGYANNTVTIPTITNITPSKNIVCQGYNMSINATVFNQGSTPLSLSLTLYANTTTIGTEIVTNLLPGTSTNITFNWDTTGDFNRYANYTLSANDILSDIIVTITYPGDVINNKKIDIFDIVLIAGSYQAQKGEPEFNPNCDIDDNEIINIFDVVIAATNYGYEEPP